MSSKSFHRLDAPYLIEFPSAILENVVERYKFNISENKTNNIDMGHHTLQKSFSMDFAANIRSRRKSLNKSDGDLLNFHL